MFPQEWLTNVPADAPNRHSGDHLPSLLREEKLNTAKTYALQIALWAVSLSFEHPTRHDTLRFTSAPPTDGAWQWFQDVIGEMTL